MRRRLPPLDSLRYLEASARLGSFTRAAEELGVTPAAVSLRVRELELDLGVRLFGRSGPRIKITEQGRKLADRMSDALALIENGVTSCCRPQPLRVTSAPTYARRWLLPHLASYDRLGGPQIDVDISTDMRSEEEFDVAIRSGFPTVQKPGIFPLMPVLRTPMVAPSLAKGLKLDRPADLLKLPLIPDPDWTNWFRLAGVAHADCSFGSVGFESQDSGAGAAARGAGAALLSPLLFGDMVRDGLLLQPFPDVLETGEVYYLQISRSAAAHASAFVDWLLRINADGPGRAVRLSGPEIKDQAGPGRPS